MQALLASSVASVALSQAPGQVLDLSNVEWTVTSPNFSYISVPGKIPSQAHLDLHAAQVSCPMLGENVKAQLAYCSHRSSATHCMV
jgi:beta-mannosidase